ncbi:MAG: YggS family pyridoxal phosphate-dependent enzyme [Clostridia bacterium]|nr:YggS family pyridoxal phosphate-dependent enzyme [Clostridia bacterium]
MTEKWSEDPCRQVRENLARIEENILSAAIASGRKRADITLMAVTKTIDPQRINAALDAGVRCIGENRVQEYLEKKDRLHLEGVSKHLIGHLQTNKVRQIVGQVDMIQSVDSIRLAEKISQQALACGLVMPVLWEVNIGREASKSGVDPEALPPMLEAAAQLPGIRVKGLMTVPPAAGTDTEKRKVFSAMYHLFIDIKDKNIDNISMDVLSMGMSGDYRQAVLEGATMLRIGSALFGPRVY